MGRTKGLNKRASSLKTSLGQPVTSGEGAQDRWQDGGGVFSPGESDLPLGAESSSPLQTPSKLQMHEQFVIILSLKSWVGLLHNSWYLNTASVSW